MLNRKSRIIAVAAFFLIAGLPRLFAQANPPKWTATWITHPTAPLREPIVLYFRKSVSLHAAPSTFPVRVSADNRFVLYVNGKRVGDGPARGDLNHWRYESFDLAPYMVAGENQLAAVVWNCGIYGPLAQISDRTAFLLEGDGDGAIASTDKGWQVEIESGRKIISRQHDDYHRYFAIGPGEQLNAAQYDWDWTKSK